MLKKVKTLKGEVIGSYGGRNGAGERTVETSVIGEVAHCKVLPPTREGRGLTLTTEKEERWNVALYFQIFKCIIIMCVLTT